MTRRGIVVVLSLGLLLAVTSRISFAQDNDDIQQGIKAYGTYRGGDIDSVSMTNGNLILKIPLVSFPERGKLHLGFELVYNRQVYTQKTMCQADALREFRRSANIEPIHVCREFSA